MLLTTRKRNKSIVKPTVATNFKKKGKGKGICFVCSSSEHWAKECMAPSAIYEIIFLTAICETICTLVLMLFFITPILSLF
jgi:hypothetical protein